MPAVQVSALHTFQQYERIRDDLFKWTSVPLYQSYKGMDDALAHLHSESLHERPQIAHGW